jgi:uncharacterized membrane protein
MTLESGRKLGIISSLLTVILPVLIGPIILLLTFARITEISTHSTTSAFVFSTIPIYAVIGILGVVSVILFLISMHRLANYFHEPAIFKNTLYGFILNIVGSTVGVALEFALLISALIHLQVGTAASVNAFGQVIIALLAVSAVIFVFAIVGAVFYMHAFNALGQKSGIDSFKTAGLLILVGYALTIVFVGALIIWVAWIMVTIGFFSLKQSKAPTFAYAQQPQYSYAPYVQVKYCTSCGAANTLDAKFCNKCGKPMA